MSKDFKITLGIVALVVLVGGVAFAGWKMLLEPIWQRDDQIMTAQLAIHKETQKLRKIHKQRAQLHHYRLTSLPADASVASHEYRAYLRSLFTKAGVRSSDYLLPTGKVIQKKINPPGVKGYSRKKIDAVYKLVQFNQIRVEASLRSVAELLRRFDEAPVLHRIKAMSIEPKDRKKYGTSRLKLTMDVEALIVEGAEIRGNSLFGIDERLVKLEVFNAMRGGPNGLALIPWLVGPTGPVGKEKLVMARLKRDYRVIGEKSIFDGYKPPPLPIPKDPKPVDTGPRMHAYVYLAQIIRSDIRDEAFLRNKLIDPTLVTQAYIRLRFSRLYGNFTIKGLNGETQISGKVARIDDREVYVNVGGEVFRIRLGQTLESALSYPLRDAELKKLGIKIEKNDEP